MPDPLSVAGHYTRDGLIEAIVAGLDRLGLTPETAGLDDLAPVDEFHIGGRTATEAFLDRMDLDPADHVLDVGCGLGGASRFAARRYGCRVTGIDLTQVYVDTGTVLCAWLGLSDRVSLECGDATAAPYADGAFDAAYMLHVGMNIADKVELARELYRLVRPGGKAGIYDVMRVGSGALTFPVPWATQAQGSALATPREYRDALAGAGFRIVAERNRRDFAVEFFARLKAASARAEGPPPLGLHILMGETAAAKIENMVENIARNRIAPVELIAERPA